jgi:hypothetical protein
MNGNMIASTYRPKPAFRTREEMQDFVIEPSEKKLDEVTEPTIYPAQFSILFRERMQGQTIEQAAAQLQVSPQFVERIVEGTWRPSEAICKKMGLKVVYAISEPPAETDR